jgi:hypothetical protein
MGVVFGVARKNEKSANSQTLHLQPFTTTKGKHDNQHYANLLPLKQSNNNLMITKNYIIYSLIVSIKHQELNDIKKNQH